LRRAIAGHTKLSKTCSVDVAGRDIDKWRKYLSKSDHGELLRESVRFQRVDIDKMDDLQRLVPKYDLIVHTAGPFQGLKESNVLKCALEHGKLYIDVCDDIELSRSIRKEPYQVHIHLFSRSHMD
jgi:saccharopine dehydrogenase-like NADP-dependent oxidoreductase